MWDWITGAAGSVLSAISGLIGWVWKLILLYIVRKQAKESVRKEIREDAIKTIKEQRDIANQPKLRRDAILDRMLKRKRPD